MRKVRQFFLFTLLLAFFSYLLNPIVYAQNGITPEEQTEILDLNDTTSSIIPPYPGDTPFLGQEHDYSVIFRGNGETVVNLKVIFNNSSDKEREEFLLRIPKGDSKELVAFQVYKEPDCIRYDTSVVPSESLPSKPLLGEAALKLPCLEYGMVDFGYGYGMQYIKAESKLEGDTIAINLPKPIQSNKQGAFFVHFRSFGYVEKSLFGAFNYKFETLKVEDEISTLNVGISTDSDLKLRGAKADVNYRYQEFGSLGIQATPGVEFKNSSLDNYYGQIGQGTITKTASSLSPFESFTVEGTYAKSLTALYAKELIITLAVVAVIILFFIFALRSFTKRVGKLEVKVGEDVSNNKRTKLTLNLIITLGTGFLSSILIVGYTFLLFFLVNFLQGGYFYQLQMVIVILIIIVSFLVYSLLFFGPAIVIGYKRGLVWGIATVAFSLLFLLLSSFVVIVVLQLFFPMNYPQPVFRGL